MKLATPIALVATVLAVGTACSLSPTHMAASRHASESPTAVSAAPTTRTAPVVAKTASEPEVLLARLHAAGVACNYLPTAYQYGRGFSQIQCIRGPTSPAPKTPLPLVTHRVYDSAATKTRDLAALRSEGGTELVGPNWAALPDPDFPLPVLHGALGGNVVR